MRAYEEPDGGEVLGPDGEKERGLHTAHIAGVGISLIQLQRLTVYFLFIFTKLSFTITPTLT
jgi:hypothetical protein